MKSNVLNFPKRKEFDSDVDSLQLDSNGFVIHLPPGSMKFKRAHEELTNAASLLSALENRSSIGRREAFELRESGEKIRECLAVFANMIALLEARESPIAVMLGKESPPTER